MKRYLLVAAAVLITAAVAGHHGAAADGRDDIPDALVAPYPVRPDCVVSRRILRPARGANPVPAGGIEPVGAFRIVPPGAYGAADYEECPVLIDLGAPGVDEEELLHGVPLYSDASAHVPDGFHLTAVLPGVATYSNAVVGQRFERRDGAWLEVWKSRVFELPVDYRSCTGPPSCHAIVFPLRLPGLLGMVSHGYFNDNMEFSAVRDGVLISASGSGVGLGTLVEAVRGVADTPERTQPVGVSTPVDLQMLLALALALSSLGSRFVGPCWPSPEAEGTCYEPESLDFGGRVRIVVGSTSKDGAIVYYLTRQSHGGYVLDDNGPEW